MLESDACGVEQQSGCSLQHGFRRVKVAAQDGVTHLAHVDTQLM